MTKMKKKTYKLYKNFETKSKNILITTKIEKIIFVNFLKTHIRTNINIIDTLCTIANISF